MTPNLYSERLILQPLTLEDVAQVQSIFPRWEIVRYLASSVPWPYPSDGALRYYREVALPAVASGEEWHWSLRLRNEPAKLLGVIALVKGPEDNRGFWIGPEWQGQGLISEAANAVTEFWFEALQFPVMRVQKAAINGASRRISEKSGMRLVGMIEKEYVCGRLSTEVWEITAEEWRRHHRQMLWAKARRI